MASLAWGLGSPGRFDGVHNIRFETGWCARFPQMKLERRPAGTQPANFWIHNDEAIIRDYFSPRICSDVAAGTRSGKPMLARPTDSGAAPAWMRL